MVGRPPMEFDSRIVTIGRVSSNAVCIKDPRISGVHGEIVLRDNQYLYRDLRSTNGSLVKSSRGEVVVDGVKVREVEILDGDLLLLGDRSQPVRLAVRILADEEQGLKFVSQGRLHSAEHILDDLSGGEFDPAKETQSLVSYLTDLGEAESFEQACRVVLQRQLRFVEGAAFGSVVRPDGESLSYLLTHLPHGGSLSVEAGELDAWLPEPGEWPKRWVTAVPASLRERLAGATSVIAIPLSDEGQLPGWIVLGRVGEFGPLLMDRLSFWITIASPVLRLQQNEVRSIQVDEATSDGSVPDPSPTKPLPKLTWEMPERVLFNRSGDLATLMSRADMAAATEVPLLVIGEHATGRRQLVQAIHSKRSPGTRLEAITCTSAPRELSRALFGDGESEQERGRLLVAGEGGLLLHNVHMADKVVADRIAQLVRTRRYTSDYDGMAREFEGQIYFTATPQLLDLVEGGTFSVALYEMINAFPLRIPPVRERPKDLPLLCAELLSRYAEEFGERTPSLSEEALSRVRGYSWPGNLRELCIEFEGAVSLASGAAMIAPAHFSDRIGGAALPTVSAPLKEVMEEIEYRYVMRVLNENEGNRTKASEVLGISRQALTQKLRKYGVGPRYG
ncbi:MAG: FHA domain-containing protein [Myxococcales bacterium]|nr:FHA domain-containing protein [Myxococcales bacterium]